MKIISLVKNQYTNDARVSKTTQTLITFGNDVTVIAEKAYKELPLFENIDYPVFRIPVFSSLYAMISSKKIDTIRSRSNLSKFDKIKIRIRNNKIRRHIVRELNSIFYTFQAIILGIKLKPDLVISNDLDTLTASFVISKFSGAKIIYDSHELWFSGVTYLSSSRLKQTFWRYLEKKLIHKTDAVIVTTNSRAEYLKNKYSLDEVYIVRNCPKFQAPEYTDILRKEFNIPSKHKILIYHGLIKRARGIFDIIKAVESINNVSLIIMGDGVEKEEVSRVIEKNKLENNIFLKDAVPYPEVIKTIASADIGLQPFHYTFNHYTVISNKLFECIMAGIASIGSDFPEMKKVIEDNNIGLTHTEQNIDQIRTAMLKLVNDDLLLSECKKNARNIRNNHTWEKEETTWKFIIESVSGEKI